MNHSVSFLPSQKKIFSIDSPRLSQPLLTSRFHPRTQTIAEPTQPYHSHARQARSGVYLSHPGGLGKAQTAIFRCRVDIFHSMAEASASHSCIEWLIFNAHGAARSVEYCTEKKVG